MARLQDEDSEDAQDDALATDSRGFATNRQADGGILIGEQTCGLTR